MADSPVIQANLIDIRNVATQKEVRLELRVPAEYAAKVFDIFGWPTAVAPVPVAICPLTAERKPEPPPEAPKDRPSFTKLPRAQQAGIRCQERAFWSYLTDRFIDELGKQVVDAEGAAHVVRWHCLVSSRSALDRSAGAGELWDALEADFYAKQHGMH